MSDSRTSDVNHAIDRLIEREGGYTNDVDDAGGETKFGISKRRYPLVDIKKLTREQAADYYWRDFYDGPGFSSAPVATVEPIFDLGVHSGPSVAVSVAQRALGIDVDGKFGPQTRKALQEADPLAFRKKFLLERLLHYVNVVIARPTNLKYLRGWVRRAVELL